MKNRLTPNQPPVSRPAILGFGILEQLDAKVEAVQSALEALAEQVRASAPVAATGDAGNVWSGGACDLDTAATEYGLSRSELYKRMNSGELPFSCPTRVRLVPRRALVAILRAAEVKAADPEPE